MCQELNPHPLGHNATSSGMLFGLPKKLSSVSILCFIWYLSFDMHKPLNSKLRDVDKWQFKQWLVIRVNIPECLGESHLTRSEFPRSSSRFLTASQEKGEELCQLKHRQFVMELNFLAQQPIL